MPSPLTKTAGPFAPGRNRRRSRNTAPLAAAAGVLLLSMAVLFAGYSGGLPAAYADGHDPLTVTIAAETASPTDLYSVSFGMNFSRYINSSTLEVSDIEAPGGTVHDLRAVLQYQKGFGSPATGGGQFATPNNVAIDSSKGLLYLAADTRAGGQLDDIHVFNLTTLTYIKGVTARSFNNPGDVAVDGARERLFVVHPPSSNPGITVFVYNSDTLAPLGNLPGTFTNPRGLAFDAVSDRLYVADGNRVGAYRGVTLASLGNLADGITFDTPRDIAVNSTGHIFVADHGNERVVIYNADMSHHGTMVIPRDSYGLYQVTLTGIAVDRFDNLYVSNQFYENIGRIAIYNPALEYVGNLPGSNIAPRGITVDPVTDAMYVAAGSTIRIFNATYAFNVTDLSHGQTLDVRLPAGRVETTDETANTASNTVSIRIERNSLEPVITATQRNPTNESPINFQVRFGESVTGFEADDIVLSGEIPPGGVTNFAGSGTLYTFDLAPTVAGTINVDIAAGAAQSTTGSNPTEAAARFRIFYTDVQPTPLVPAVTPVQRDPTSLESVPFNLTFNRHIDASSLEASDITVSTGTVHDLRTEWYHNKTVGGRGGGGTQFDLPWRMAVNGTGHVYVADSGNDRVQIFNSTLGDNSTLPRPFDNPTDVAIGGPSGYIYVAVDASTQNRVEILYPNHTSLHNITHAFSLQNIQGVAVNGTGHVFAADTINAHVAVFDGAWNHIHNITGVASDGVSPDPFVYQTGVAVDDATGNIYVADTLHDPTRVRVFDRAMQYVADLPGPFNRPTDVTVDGPSGNIYVAGNNDNRIHIFNSTLDSIGSFNNGFNNPTGVAIDDTSGTLYVVENSAHRVQSFDISYAFNVTDLDDGDTLTVSLPAGRVDAHDGVPNTGSAPASIYIDRTAPKPAITSPSLLQAGGHTSDLPVLFRVDFGGPVDGFEAADITLYSNVTTGGVENFEGGDGDAVYTFEVSPRPSADALIRVDIAPGAAQDAAKNPSIAADRFEIEYSPVPLIPTITSTQSGTTNLPTVPFNLGFNRAINSSTLVAADIEATEGTVQNLRTVYASVGFDGSGSATGTFAMPDAIAVNGTGHIFVADRERGGHVTVFNSSLGYVGHIGGLSFPNGVAVDDTTGTIYVSDTGNDAVRIYDLSLASRGGEILSGFGLGSPERVAVDGTTGRVYVLTTNTDTIHVFNSTTRASIGTIGSFGSLAQITFNMPVGVAATQDGSGTIYVADTPEFGVGGHVVRAIDTSSSSRGNFGNLAGTTFNNIQDVAVDPDTGNIYAVDNNRIAIFDPSLAHIDDITSISGSVGVGVDTTGTVYVTRNTPNTVSIFDLEHAFEVAGLAHGDALEVSLPAGRVYASDNKVVNEASNRLSLDVDMAAPVLVSAAVTGPNNVTITYDTPANAATSAYGTLTVGTGARAFTLTGAGTPTHVLTFAGAAAPPDATGTLVIDQTKVTDAVANALGTQTALSQTLADGQAPGITSAAVTGPDEVTVRYTEPVTATAAAYGTLTVDGSARTYTAVPAAGTPAAVHTLTFTGTPAPRTAAGTLVMNQTGLTDGAGTALGTQTAFSQTLRAGQAPGITSAAVTGPDKVTIRYTISVAATAAAYGTLTVDGSARTYTVDPSPGTSSPNHTLTFTGAAAPPDAAGTLVIDQTAVTDPALSVNLGTQTALLQTLTDGQAPGITSAAVTGPREVTVRYTEPVTATAAAYGTLTVDGSARTYTAVPAAGTPAAVHTLTFTGTPAPRTAAGTLVMNQTGLTDGAGTALGTQTAFSQTLTDGQAPGITSAAVTGPDKVTIRYSTSVAATAAAYGTLTVDGSARTYTVDPSPGTSSPNHTLTFTGAAAPPDAAGTLVIDQTAVTDPALSVNLGTQTALLQTLTDGQAPSVVSAVITGPHRFTVQYSEPVSITGLSAYGTLLIEGTSRAYAADWLAGDGTASHTITFVGTPAAPDDAGTVPLDHTAIKDDAGNAMGTDRAVSQALEGGGQLIPHIATAATSPTALDPVPFSLDFSRVINATTLDAADISTTSGTVRNLRIALDHASDLGSSTGSNNDQFNRPQSLAFDGTAGLLYVADRLNSRVQVFDGALGYVATIRADDLFSSPYGVGVNGTGHIFVADTGKNRVVIFDPGRDQIGTITGFNQPRDVAVNGTGHIFVANSGTNQILIYDGTTLTGTASIGGTGVFTFPTGVAVNGTGHMFVADRNGDRIRVYDRALNHVTNIENNLREPNAVTVDPVTGDIYVADTKRHRIQVFDAAGGHLATVGTPTAGIFNFPAGIAVDPATATVYVADSEGTPNRLRTFDISYAFDVASPDDQDTLEVSLPLGAVRDFDDNANAASGTVSVDTDRAAPSVRSANITASNEITITYSEPVNATGTAAAVYGTALTVDGTSATFASGNFLSGNGTDTHVLALAGTPAAATNATGTITVDQTRLTDAAGSPVGASASFSQDLADGQPPSIISAAVTDSDKVTIRYTELVDAATGAYGTLTVDGSSRTHTLSGDGTAVHTLTFTGAAATAQAVGTLVLNQAALTDKSDNALGTDTSFSQDLAVGQAPDVTITSGQTGPTNAATIGFTVTFSSAVTGFDSSDITLGGTATLDGTVKSFTEATTGRIYTFEVTPTASGTVTVEIAAGAADDAVNGNPSRAADLLSVEYDGTAPVPTVTSVQWGRTNSATVNFAVNFTEPVEEFVASNITLTGTATLDGTVKNFAVFNASSYTFDATPTADGTVLVDVPAGGARDIAGNLNSPAARYSIVYDSRSPVPTITPVQPGPTSLQTVSFSMSFDEFTHAAAIGTSAVNATSGTVQNLNPTFRSGGSLNGLLAPYGMAVDGSGNIYVAEQHRDRHRITVLDPAGVAIDTIGDLRYPRGVAIDSITGNIYVADTGNGRVKVYDETRDHIGQLAGSFNGPEDVAVDSRTGYVYVADTQNLRIKVFDSATLQQIGALPGFGPTVPGRPSYGFTVGLAVDSATSTIYARDSTNNLIRIFNGAWEQIGTITGEFGDSFGLQSGIAVDSTGAVYVAEPSRGIISVYNSTGDRIAKIDPPGNPQRVAVNGTTGTVYVTSANHGSIRTFEPGYSFEVDSPTDQATLAVNLLADRVRDEAGNENAASGIVRVEIDRIAPAVLWANITAPDTVVIRYTEPVDATGTPYGALDIGGTAASLAATSPLSGDGTATHTLTLAGTPASAANATGTIRIDQTGLADGAGTALGVSTSFEQDLSDGQRPSVDSAAVTGPQEITIRYSEPVNAAGSAYGTLTVDGTTRTLGSGFLAGDGTDTHVLTFTGTAATARAVGTLVLNQEGLTDDAANALGTDTSFSQDLAAGQAPGVIITSGESNPTNSATIGFTVTFSSTVTGFAATDIDLSASTATLSGTVKDFATTTAGLTYTFNVTPTGDGLVLVDIPAGVANDSVNGMPNKAADRFSIEYDDNAPVPAVTSVQRDPTNSTTINFAVNFTDPVTGKPEAVIQFRAGNISLVDSTAPHGGVTNFNMHNGSSYTFDVTPTGDGLIRVDVPANGALDPAGNPSTAAAQYPIEYDGTTPAPVITSVQGDGPTGAPVITFRVGFGERVDGFTAGDIAVSGTSSPGSPAGFGPHDTINYTFTVSPTTDGTVLVDIGAGAAHDEAGNPSTAATRFEIEYDSALASTIITSVQHPGPTNSTEINFRVNFGSAVTGFEVTDIDLSASTASHGGATNLVSIDGGANHTFNVAPTANGIIQVDIAAGAATYTQAGGGTTGIATYQITYDGSAPVPTVTSVQPDPTNSATINFAVNFTDPVTGAREAVTGFTAADISLAAGISQHGGVTDFTEHNASSYTFNVAPAADGLIRVDVPAGGALDPAGNPSTAAAQYPIRYDGTAPEPVITSTKPDRTGSRVIDFNVGFGETVEGFADADITVGGTSTPGAITGFTRTNDGANYTFNVAPTANGTVTVDVAASVATDLAGNPNMVATQISIEYNSTLQGTTITSVQSDPTNVPMIEFTVDFVNPVTGFDQTDIVLTESTSAPGPVTGFTPGTDGSNYTFNVAPTRDGTIQVDIAADAGTYTGGEGTDAATYSIVYDSSAPVPTVTSVQHPGPTNEATVLFAVNFTDPVTGKHEPVNGFAAGDITVAGDDLTLTGGIQNFNRYNGSSYTFELTPTGDGTIRVEVPAGGAADDAGNDNTAAARYSIEYDDEAPYTRITSTRSDPTGASTIGFEVGFGEEVRNFASTDITVSGTSGATTLTGFAQDGLNYTFNVAPVGDGTVLVDVGAGVAQDIAGNDNTAAPQFSIEYNSTLLATEISSVQSDPTNATPIGFTVDFGDPVNGFAPDDIALGGTAAPSGGVRSFAGADGDTAYTFEAVPIRDGTVTVSVPDNAATYAGSGDPTTAATFSIRYDGSAPSPTIGSTARPTGTATVNFWINFTDSTTGDPEPVEGFAAGDISLAGSTARLDGGVKNFVRVDGSRYTFDVTPTADGTITVDVPAGAADDKAGNGNAAARYSIGYDGPPSIASAQVTGPNQITVRYTEPVNAAGSAYGQTTFRVDGLDRTVVPGSPAGNGTAVHTLGFVGAEAAPDAVGSITIDRAAITDLAGNRLGDTAVLRQLTDGQAPAVVSASITGITRITVLYTEPVNAAATAYGQTTLRVDGADLAVDPGSLLGDGTPNHDLIFTGGQAGPDSTGRIMMNLTAVSDHAGNPLGTSASFERDLADGRAPQLLTAALNLMAGDNGVLALAFNEAVTAPATDFAGEITITGTGSPPETVTLSGGDIDGVTPAAAPGKTFLLEISGAKRILLNTAAFGSSATTIGLPSTLTSDHPAGNALAGETISLPTALDTTPPVLTTAAVDLAPSDVTEVDNNNVSGHLILTFDQAVTEPDVASSGALTVLGADGARITLAATDVPSIASGTEGDKTFKLRIADSKRVALNNANYSDPQSTNITLSADIVSNGQASYDADTTQVPLTVTGLDSGRPSVVQAIIAGDTSIAVIYSEPVRNETSHYTNITVTDGTGNTTSPQNAMKAASFGSSVLVSWSSTTIPTGDAGSGVTFNITGVTDIFGNALAADDIREHRTDKSGQIDLGNLGDTTVDIPVAADSTIDRITTAGGTEPVIWLGPSGTFPSHNFTVSTAASTVVFPPSTVVTTTTTTTTTISDEPKTVLIGATARGPTPDEIAGFKRVGPATPDYDYSLASVVEFGDPSEDLNFTAPVRVTIPGLQDIVFSVNSKGDVLRIDDCHAALAPQGDHRNATAAIAALDKTRAGYDPAACRVQPDTDTVWTTHFSAIGSAPKQSAPDTPTQPVQPVQPAAPTTGGRSSGGGGGGGGSGGGGGGGGGGPSVSLPATDIYISSVSWNCTAGIVSITAGPDSENLSVSVRTAVLGHQQAVRTGDAPAAIAPPGYGTFLSSMDEGDGYLGVRALLQSGRTLSTTGESVAVDSCIGQRAYSVPSGASPAPGRPSPDAAPAPAPAPAQDTPAPARTGGEAQTSPAPAPPASGNAGTPEPPVAAPPPPPPPPPPPQTEPDADAPAPPPETNGDGCGPGTVSRDGVCVVIMPDADGDGTDGTVPTTTTTTATTGDGAGGCLIATAAYGTELAPQVQQLRELRDATVLSTAPGASFMGAFNTAYYAVSPAVADLERQNPAFRDLVRASITPGIWALGAVMPMAEPGSDVSVSAAGILSMVLLAGIYAGPPVLGAYVATRYRHHRNGRSCAA